MSACKDCDTSLKLYSMCGRCGFLTHLKTWYDVWQAIRKVFL